MDFFEEDMRRPAGDEANVVFDNSQGKYDFDAPSEGIAALIEGLELTVQEINEQVESALFRYYDPCQDILTPVTSFDESAAQKALEDRDALDDLRTPVFDVVPDVSSSDFSDMKTPAEGIDYEAAVAAMFNCEDVSTVVVKDLNEKTVVYTPENRAALISYSAEEDESDMYDTMEIDVIDRKVRGYLSFVDKRKMPFRSVNLLNVMGFAQSDSDNEMVDAYSIIMGMCKENGWYHLEAVAIGGWKQHMRNMYDCRSE